MSILLGGIAAESLGAELRQTEVENLDAVLGDDDVAGLQVAMDHALGVRGGQRIDDLHRITQGLIERQRTSFDDLRERLALDVLHHQVIRADIVQRADVGMIERGDGARLALEAIVELARGNLDRDGPVEARVGAEVHLAHAALADHRQNLVVTKLFAGGQGHKD